MATETTAEAILIGSAKVLWWVHLAWALIGFVRIYLVIERKPREARLLQDLVVGVVYVGMLLSILAFVFGVPIGTLIATSGVFAIILGLALQNTLSDVFSGIALNLGRPYVLGDWIVLSDGTEGRVVETNWRSTHLLTLAHNVVALPNSFLAKLGLTNVSSPDESHGLSLTVRLAPTKMPAIVVDVMRTVLLSCNSDPEGTAAPGCDQEVWMRRRSRSNCIFASQMSTGELPRGTKFSISSIAMPSPPGCCWRCRLPLRLS